MKEIKRIKIAFLSEMYGIKFYEVRHYWDNEDGEERFNTFELSFKKLKRMGVVKTFNSGKKLETWLNGEGREWYIQQLNEKYPNSYIAQ